MFYKTLISFSMLIFCFTQALCWGQTEEPSVPLHVIVEARKIYSEKTLAAKTDLQEAIQVRIEEAADKGDLDRVDLLKTELKKFTDKGTLPLEKVVAEDVAKYRRDIKQYFQEMIQSLESAQIELTKQREFDKARSIRDELQNLQKPEKSDVVPESPVRILLEDAVKQNPGLELNYTYDDASLDCTFEVWRYKPPRDGKHHQINLIHCTRGEARLTGFLWDTHVEQCFNK